MCQPDRGIVLGYTDREQGDHITACVAGSSDVGILTTHDARMMAFYALELAHHIDDPKYPVKYSDHALRRLVDRYEQLGRVLATEQLPSIDVVARALHAIGSMPTGDLKHNRDLCCCDHTVGLSDCWYCVMHAALAPLYRVLVAAAEETAPCPAKRDLSRPDTITIAFKRQELSALIEACNVTLRHPTEARPPWPGDNGKTAWLKLVNAERDQ